MKIKLDMFVMSMIALSSCTYNISMAHTEGQATDVVDTEQSARAKVDPSINVPVQSPSSPQSVQLPKEEPKPAQA